MILKEKKDFAIVSNGKIELDVSELFQDGENVEVVVSESYHKIIQMTLHVEDEAYEHIKYLLENLKGVTIIEDKYIEETL